LDFACGKGELPSQLINPVNNVRFSLCIWKEGGYYLKHTISPVNNVAFVICIWKRRGRKGIL